MNKLLLAISLVFIYSNMKVCLAQTPGRHSGALSSPGSPSNTGSSGLLMPSLPADPANTGGSTLPTLPNTGTSTLPTLPNTGTSTLPTAPANTGTSLPTLPQLPGTPVPGSAANEPPATIPSTTTATSTGLPAPITGNPAVPDGALSANTPGAPETATGLKPPAPPPLMGTITQEVSFTIDKQPVQRGPFAGVVVHVHNGTNSPLVFDGEHAFVTLGGQKVCAATDVELEMFIAKPPSHAREAALAVETFATIGASAAIPDEVRSRGPILPRFGADQMRREATSERFGLRILWPGDETQGIMFFRTSERLDGSHLQLPVMTYPTFEVRGYLTCVK